MRTHLESLAEIVDDASIAIGGLGVAVVVFDGAGTVFEHAAGAYDVRIAGSQVSLADPFGAASISKVATALAALRLVERGALALDTSVADVLREFEGAPREITVARLLTHTSGLPTIDPYTWHHHAQNDENALSDTARLAAFSSRIATPGERFVYSDLGFDVLGAVLERVEGRAFEDVVAREVFAPLGMSGASMRPGAKYARPHALDAAGAPRAFDSAPYNRAHAPSGAMHASVRELARLGGALLDDRLLAAASRTAMTVPRTSTGRAATPSVGLGLLLRERPEGQVVGHGGLDVGYRCGLSMIPSRGVGVAVMTNAMWSPVFDVCEAALDAVFGLPPRDVTPRARLVELEGGFESEGDVVQVARDRCAPSGLALDLGPRRGAWLAPVAADTLVCPADDDPLNRRMVSVRRGEVTVGERRYTRLAS